MIALNRRRVMGGEKLPYDAQIEYLESTGTQYIDTGISVQRDIEIECDYSFTNVVPVWRRLFGYGGLNNDHVFTFAYFSGEKKPRFITKKATEVFADEYGAGRYTVKMNANGNVSLIGTNYSYTNTIDAWNIGQDLYPIFLYNFGGVNLVDYAICRVYSFMLRKGSQKLLDLIPVRVGTVGYMYDRVSKQLFGNSGTGNFILGGDV